MSFDELTGWTLETLYTHLTTVLDLQERRFNDRHDASDKAVAHALASAALAVSKAEAANEKRFDSVNEFRSLVNDLLADQKAAMMPRREVEMAFANVGAQIIDLSNRITELTTSVSLRSTESASETKGRAQSWKDIALVITTVVAVLAIASRFL